MEDRTARWIRCSLCFALPVLLAVSLAAQERTGAAEEPGLEMPEDRAILIRGPAQVRGIDELGPNVLPAWKGQYALGTYDFFVTFTSSPVTASDAWEAAPCRTTGLYRIPDHERGDVFVYRSIAGWTVIFTFPETVPDPCRTMTIFLNRFQFFLSATRNTGDIPFPAILEVER